MKFVNNIKQENNEVKHNEFIYITCSRDLTTKIYLNEIILLNLSLHENWIRSVKLIPQSK